MKWIHRLYYTVALTIIMDGTLVCMSSEQQVANPTENSEVSIFECYPEFMQWRTYCFIIDTYAFPSSRISERDRYVTSLLTTLDTIVKFQDKKWSVVDEKVLHDFMLDQPGIRKEIKSVLESKGGKGTASTTVRSKFLSLESTIAQVLENTTSKYGSSLYFNAKPLEEYVIRNALNDPKKMQTINQKNIHEVMQKLDTIADQKMQKESSKRMGIIGGSAFLVGGAFIALKLFNAHQKV